MFRWLTRLVWRDDFIEDIASGGFGGRLTRLIKQHAQEEKRQRHEKEVRPRLERELTSPTMARWESERKRELLELKLEDAEWILEHEERLAPLQKKLRGNDHKRNSLEPTPTASGDWSTTSKGSARTSPSTSVSALSFEPVTSTGSSHPVQGVFCALYKNLPFSQCPIH